MKKDTSRLTDHVIDTIRREILSGTLTAGTRLPSERELSERFGVSRITIRAAIARLAHLGFVETLPQSGTFVRDFWSEATLELLIDVVTSKEPVEKDILVSLMDLRRIVEVYATERAVARMTSEDTEKLRDTVHSMNTERNMPENLVSLDYELHTAYVKKSGNRVIQVIYNTCRPVYMFYLEFFYALPGSPESIIPYYERLVAATESGDAQHSAFLMEELLVFAENRVNFNNSLS
jgi:GntR family transcriptional regulator, transcriptional repressor for pyruvate dehydrogenase complex